MLALLQVCLGHKRSKLGIQDALLEDVLLITKQLEIKLLNHFLHIDGFLSLLVRASLSGRRNHSEEVLPERITQPLAIIE